VGVICSVGKALGAGVEVEPLGPVGVALGA
jgi:hypothetical protein